MPQRLLRPLRPYAWNQPQCILGWSDRADVANWPTKQYEMPRPRGLFEDQWGEIHNVAFVRFAAGSAQVANWRHSQSDERQFPRAVCFLRVRILRALYRKGLLSI